MNGAGENRSLRIAILCKSDSTGGAAVVSRRLMEALRNEGADARMLVVEKLTESPYVGQAAPEWRERIPFLTERLKVFLSNGFNRSKLFLVDPGSDGLPLWRHPIVENADAVLINWVNQGMLSLDGVSKIAASGKKIIWTMHDMWCMTGICHHAGACTHYQATCGDCPLLGKKGSPEDMSRKVWKKKKRLNSDFGDIEYVAVSNWLAGKAKESGLLRDCHPSVIPNPFPLPETSSLQPRKAPDGKIRLLFGAARLDDPVKGLPALIEMTKAIRKSGEADKYELVTFGNYKNPAAFDGVAVEWCHLGHLKSDKEVRGAYESCHIVVSSSHFETLPGTLVEAQAYGCIPVAFDSGGQRDIVEEGVTGFLCPRPQDNGQEAGKLLARCVGKAADVISDPACYPSFIRCMQRNVEERFSAQAVARAYLNLISQ